MSVPEGILGDIKSGAVRSFQPQGANIGFVLGPMAALLVKLSGEAEASLSGLNARIAHLTLQADQSSRRLELLTRRLYNDCSPSAYVFPISF